GYFAMPVLSGGRLVGRVDPAREGRTLVAKQVPLDGPRAVPALARALAEAAGWVDCPDVRVERLDREERREPLTAELAHARASPPSPAPRQPRTGAGARA